MNHKNEFEKTIEVLDSDLQGIGKKRIRVLLLNPDEKDVLMDEEKQTFFGENGGIERETTKRLKEFADGTISDIDRVIGTMCAYCRKIALPEYTFHCECCGIPLCIRHKKRKFGYMVCNKHFWILTLFPFLRRGLYGI